MKEHRIRIRREGKEKCYYTTEPWGGYEEYFYRLPNQKWWQWSHYDRRGSWPVREIDRRKCGVSV